ncbi:MAG: YncE family protein [Candidatus Peribacteraceae bacterium]|nr:YncE family protein [Candidatus Peribacteraceae bacterium]
MPPPSRLRLPAFALLLAASVFAVTQWNGKFADTGGLTAATITPASCSIANQDGIQFEYILGSAGTKLYIRGLKDGHNALLVVNTATNTVTKTIQKDCTPSSEVVSVDSKTYLLCGHYAGESSEIVVLNTATDNVLATITVPAGAVNQGFYRLTSAGSKVYALSNYGGQVHVINTATNTISKSIDVGPAPHDLVAAGTKIYVSVTENGMDHLEMNSVSVIDTATDTVVRRMTVPYADSLIVVGTKVYAFSGYWGKNGALSVINTATDSVTTVLPNASGYEAAAVGTKLYWEKQGATNCSDNVVVNMVDTATDTVTKTIPFTSCRDMHVIGTKLYTTPVYHQIHGNSIIDVFDGASGNRVEQWDIGAEPFDTGVVGTKLYITWLGHLTVINTAAPGTCPAGSHAASSEPPSVSATGACEVCNPSAQCGAGLSCVPLRNMETPANNAQLCIPRRCGDHVVEGRDIVNDCETDSDVWSPGGRRCGMDCISTENPSQSRGEGPFITDDVTLYSAPGTDVRVTSGSRYELQFGPQGFRCQYVTLEGTDGYFEWNGDAKPGTYDVYVTYPVRSDATTAATYKVMNIVSSPVSHYETVKTFAPVNQRIAPADVTFEGVGWKKIGTMEASPVSTGTFSTFIIHLVLNSSPGTAVADALMLAPTGHFASTSSAASAPSCITDGNRGEGGGSCCGSLDRLDVYALGTRGVCTTPTGGTFVCTDCGNGKCGPGENACNCVSDCGQTAQGNSSAQSSRSSLPPSSCIPPLCASFCAHNANGILKCKQACGNFPYSPHAHLCPSPQVLDRIQCTFLQPASCTYSCRGISQGTGESSSADE